MVKVLAAAAILLILAPLIAETSELPDSVRIGLTQYGSGLKQISVSSVSGAIALVSGKTRMSCNSPVSLETSATGLVCRVDNSVVNVDALVTLSPEDQGAFLVVSCLGRSDRQYRGSIDLCSKSGGVRLVNILPVDDYLKGVLPVEMGSSQPEEALNAQAIVARTYTLTNAGKHKAEGYGLCDDSRHCQTYSGVAVESERCTEAVVDTAGQAIYYGEQLAEVFYSTDCGGVTQSYEEAYMRPLYPYLSTIPDPCELKHESWEKSYALPEIAAKLTNAGIKEADGLQSIKVLAQGPSGRAQTLEVVGKLGVTTVTGSRFRDVMGNKIIKSTLFTLESADDGSITVKGKGWGHGIGLCQRGAIQLAQAPHEYICEKILAHYFPGTRISPLNSVRLPATMASAKPGIIATTNIPPNKVTATKPQHSAASAQPPVRQEKPNVLFQVRVKAPDSL